MKERFVIVIPASLQTQANAAALQFDPNGQQTFRAGLSTDGNAPATYYWCSFATENGDVIAAAVAQFPSAILKRFAGTDLPVATRAAILSELNLQPLST